MLVVIATPEIDRATVAEFRAELDDGVAAHRRCGDPELVVDLRGVRLLDSTGVRALIDAERVVVASGGRLVVHAEGVVRRVLEITGLWERVGDDVGTAG